MRRAYNSQGRFEAPRVNAYIGWKRKLVGVNFGWMNGKLGNGGDIIRRSYMNEMKYPCRMNDIGMG